MKKPLHWILLIFAVLVLIVIGILIGIFYKNFPLFTLDTNIEIIDVLTLIVTMAIGVIFPFLIKKWIDDNESIKKYLVSEIEELLSVIKANKTIIEKSYREEKFTQDDRDNVNFTFHSAELQIESLEKQFTISFPNEKKLIPELKTAYRTYKDFLTGGELMYSTFTRVELPFQKNHLNQFNNFESFLKELIHKVHRM